MIVNSSRGLDKQLIRLTVLRQPSNQEGEKAMNEQFNERLGQAYDIDLEDLSIEPEAVESWIQALQENGLAPQEYMPLARAKYDPETGELFLTIPVKDEQEEQTRQFVYVMNERFWDVNTQGRIFH
jgi:hypothetical protein